jgi:hypothetical protein
MLTSYFYVLVAMTIVMLAPICWRPATVYEYPRFMGIAFAVFILPQAYALVESEWGGVYLERTLLMCVLCLGACWVGYRRHAHAGLLRWLDVQVELTRFLTGGILLVGVAWIFGRLFDDLPEELYSTQLTGIGTVYLFFAGLVYPGFAICFYCALKQKSLIACATSVVAAIIPLKSLIFAGRREHGALFLITLGLCLYFIKGVRPPRIVTFVMITAAALLIPATGKYRATAGEDPMQAVRELNLAETFGESLNEESVSELKNATAVIAATEATGSYEYGAGYWNSLVFRFVPAQFFGKDFKDSLMIGGEQRDISSFVENALGGAFPIGTTPTGMGDSFNEFAYFGCLFFAATAYLFKTLWAAANRPNAAIAQILYIQSMTSGMRSVTHQTIDFLPGFLYSVIFIGLIAWFARVPRPVTSRVLDAAASPK